MKKHITLALWFMATLTAQAQYWVGGSVFIDRAKEEDTREYIDRTTTFNFELRPEFGYHLTDKVALGLSASYWHEYTHFVFTNNQPIVDQSQTYNAYSLTPSYAIISTRAGSASSPMESFRSIPATTEAMNILPSA